MTTYTSQTTPIFADHSRLTAAFDRFSAEVKAFAAAIISPNRIIGEVEQMVALHREASRLAATNPARAAELRQQAARICR